MIGSGAEAVMLGDASTGEPVAHLLYDPVPSRLQTGTGLWPEGWGPLL